MKKLLFVLIVLGISLALAACGKEEAKTNKTLNVGMNIEFAPFEFIDKNDRNVKGFDVDIIKAIGKDLGYEVVFQDMNYDDLLNVLEKGNIDVVISAMPLTDEKAARANFTRPYYESGIIIATLDTNKNIKNFTDLPGKRVAVVAGSQSAVEIREQKSVEVVEFSNIEDSFNALLSGKVDAVLNNKAIMDYYLNNNPKDNVIILPGIYKTEKYAIAVRKGNNELFKQIDNALQRIREKGVYNNIYDKWFGEKAK